MIQATLNKERIDDDSSNLSCKDDAYFDDNFMQRDELLNPNSINLEFDEVNQKVKPFKVDLEKCKESHNAYLQMQSLGDKTSQSNVTLSIEKKEMISQFAASARNNPSASLSLARNS